MIDKYLINSFKFFFFLIPIGLITGPFIPDLSVTLMALIFIFLSIKKSFWKKYYNNSVIKFLFLFNAYLIAISLFSDDILLSLKSSLFYFRFSIFSLAVWYLMEKSDISYKKNYIIYLFILFILLSLDAIFQYSFGQNILGFEIVRPERISSFFKEQLVLGSYQTRLLVLLMGLYIAFNIFYKNTIILGVILILTFTSVFLSGERTSFVLLLLSILLFLLFNKPLLKLLIPFIISLFLILVIAYFDKNMRYRIFVEPLHQSNLASEKLLDEFKKEKNYYVHEDEVVLIFSKEHTQQYNTAFKMFLDNPITGLGPKMFRVKCSDKKYYSGLYSCSTHPHNILMQILSETGIIGMLFYLIIIYFIISQLIRIYIKKNVNINYIKLSCLILFFINMFPFVPSGNIFNNWLSIIFYFPLGFYLYSSSMENYEKK